MSLLLLQAHINTTTTMWVSVVLLELLKMVRITLLLTSHHILGINKVYLSTMITTSILHYICVLYVCHFFF